MACFYLNDLSYFTFPLNLIFGIFLLGSIWFLHRYYRSAAFVKKLSGMPATLAVCFSIIVILIIEGIYTLQLFRTWIFVFLQLLLLIILGLVILRHTNSCSGRNVLFLLNHAGLWIALSAALLGAPDRLEGKMIVPLHHTEYTMIAQDGKVYPLPFTVRLDSFQVEFYQGNTGSFIPEYFCSTVTLENNRHSEQKNIEVNHPARFEGYTLYQDSYETERGKDSRYSILMVVKDPWIGIVYAGIFMLLAGAIGLIIYGPIKRTRS